jgi:predicted Fe-S protein YdhL (DUF1289 family)
MNGPTGLCTGCWRTMEEIVAWGLMDDASKQQVWTLIDLRQSEAALCATIPPQTPA